MLVAVFVAVTLTPGTAPPEGSVTVPVIAPVVVCPLGIGANATAEKASAKNLTIDIHHPRLLYQAESEYSRGSGITRGPNRRRSHCWARLISGRIPQSRYGLRL